VNGKHWRGHVLVLMCLPVMALQSSCGLLHDAFLALLCFVFLSFSISSAWLACPRASLSLTFLPPLSMHVLIVTHVKLAVSNLVKNTKKCLCNAATDRLHPKISTWAMLVCSASFKLLLFMFLNYFDMIMLKIKTKIHFQIKIL
jgi:hypothetical protein